MRLSLALDSSHTVVKRIEQLLTRMEEGENRASLAVTLHFAKVTRSQVVDISSSLISSVEDAAAGVPSTTEHPPLAQV